MRHELAHVYETAYGQTCRRDTLDALEAIVGWLRRTERHDGRIFVRSVPQAVRGIGWESTGSARQDHDRYRNQLVRRLEMLIRMGVVESREPLWKANQEGRGILVALRRDSSVGEALLKLASSRRPPRRPGPPSPPVAGEGPERRSFIRRVSPPLRENVPRSADGDEVPSRRGSLKGRRNGCRATRARGPGRSGTQITVTAIRSLAEAGQGSGSELIDRLPWLCDLEPAVLLRAAVAAAWQRKGSAGWRPRQGSLRISESSRLIVEAAYAELDRHDGRGAGAAAILDLAAGGWRCHTFAGRAGELEAPRTPGALAKPLRQRARMSRRVSDWRREAAA